ncbi:hypothetical protein ACA910_001263 [Epithemia clementina (nom. ined.)]
MVGPKVEDDGLGARMRPALTDSGTSEDDDDDDDDDDENGIHDLLASKLHLSLEHHRRTQQHPQSTTTEWSDPQQPELQQQKPRLPATVESRPSRGCGDNPNHQIHQIHHNNGATQLTWTQQEEQEQQRQEQQQHEQYRPCRILCDMGYGLPKEARARKEKILAISRQIVNFLWWQQEQLNLPESRKLLASHVATATNVVTENVSHDHACVDWNETAWCKSPPQQQPKEESMVVLEIVDCPDVETELALQTRMEQLWVQEITKKQQQQQRQQQQQQDCEKRRSDHHHPPPPPPLLSFPANLSFSKRSLESHYMDYCGTVHDQETSNSISTTIRQSGRSFRSNQEENERIRDGNNTTSDSGKTDGANGTGGSQFVYLSPDAPHALNASQPPPHTVVVGLLIDRRVQLGRSRQRAERFSLPMAQLPLSQAGLVLVPEHESEPADHPSPNNHHMRAKETHLAVTTDKNKHNNNPSSCFVFQSSEPLNVDCVLEMMQQWHWNTTAMMRQPRTVVVDPAMAPAAGRLANGTNTIPTQAQQLQQQQQQEQQRDCCFNAMYQALQHHAQRHPARIQHQAIATTATLEDSS